MPFFSNLLETLDKNTLLKFCHHLLISFLAKTWYIEIQESNKFSLKCHIFWHISLWIFDIILSRGAPGINSNYSVLKLPLWNINRQTRVVYYCHIPRKRPVWFITYKKILSLENRIQKYTISVNHGQTNDNIFHHYRK